MVYIVVYPFVCVANVLKTAVAIIIGCAAGQNFVQPEIATGSRMNTGERYDFIVEANQAIDNYVIMAETTEIPSKLESRGYCVKCHRAYAVLRYEGALSTLPDDFDSQYNPSERCNSTKQCYAINCPFMNYPDNVFTTCINFDQLELQTTTSIPSNDVGDTVFLNFYEAFGPALNSRFFVNPPSPILSQKNDIDVVSTVKICQMNT